MYTNGNGVPLDKVIANIWWNLAAANGHSKAGEWRDEIAEKINDLQTAGRGWQRVAVCKSAPDLVH